MSDLSVLIEPGITLGAGGVLSIIGWSIIKWLRNRLENGYIKFEIKSSSVEELKQSIQILKSEKEKLEFQNDLLKKEVEHLNELKCNFRSDDDNKGCKYVALLEELKRQKQK